MSSTEFSPFIKLAFGLIITLIFLIFPSMALFIAKKNCGQITDTQTVVFLFLISLFLPFLDYLYGWRLFVLDRDENLDEYKPNSCSIMIVMMLIIIVFGFGYKLINLPEYCYSQVAN